MSIWKLEDEEFRYEDEESRSEDGESRFEDKESRSEDEESWSKDAYFYNLIYEDKPEYGHSSKSQDKSWQIVHTIQGIGNKKEHSHQ